MFPTLHWPGWTAQLDGAPLALRPAPGSGLIALTVPPGNHTVTLQLRHTAVRLMAELFSGAAFLLLLWLLRPMITRPRLRAAGLVALMLLPLALLLHLWPKSAPATDNRTWDFAQLGYLHQARRGVPFSNGLALQSYQYDRQTAITGETFSVQMEWEGAGESIAVLELVSPAAGRPSLDNQLSPPAISSAQERVQAGTTTFSLEIPAQAPTGLFVPRLRLAAAQPMTDSGLTRGDLFLRPLSLTSGTGMNSLETTAPLEVVALGAELPAADRLELRLAWQTAKALSRNYNVALRLTDAQGNFLRLADMQPGYGHLPSSSWPPEKAVYDWLALELPTELLATPWIVVAQLYDPMVPEIAVLTRRLGTLEPIGGELRFQPHAPLHDQVTGLTSSGAVWGDSLVLEGFLQEQRGDSLTLTLLWDVRQPLAQDFTRFVHLIPLDGGVPLLQNDNFPAGGTYPTSQWRDGETIADVIAFDLATLPEGVYRLAVGYYLAGEDGRFPRLPVKAIDGSLQPEDILLLPASVPIE